MLAHFPAAPSVVSVPSFAQGVKSDSLSPLYTHIQRWKPQSMQLGYVRVALFASHYEAGADQTRATLDALQNDLHPLKKAASRLNADLQVYELDLDHSARNAAQAAQAMTYGMLAIADKGDAVIIGSLSDGVEQAAPDVSVQSEDLLEHLSQQMGLDFFSALGACLAARLAGQPVILFGAFGNLVQRVLTQLSTEAASHTMMAVADQTIAMPDLYAALYNIEQIRFLSAFAPVPHVRPV